jgi:tetraacyldisaccharide 4'-kinase
MNVLASLYGAGVRARNHLYDRGTLPARRLAGPVVSVGNLTVGGAGKTPFVIMLGEMLKARGIVFDVLSRGYGRRTRGVAMVDPEGSAADFGDEPLLIARRLGVPVVVGEDRFGAGRAAEKKLGARLHLLDDGFQHRALARDLDIVLVSHSDVRDQLLPAGRLREPLAALRRADVVVLTGEAWPTDFPIANKQVWRVRRSMVPPAGASHPVVFCGIARPQAFVGQLRAHGIQPAAEAFFRDHHPYTEKDVADLLRLKERSEADGFVTTEKDEINLGPLKARLEPLAVAGVEMALLNAATAMEYIQRAIAGQRTSSASPA